MGRYSREVKTRTAAFLLPRNTIVGLRSAVIFVFIFSHFPPGDKLFPERISYTHCVNK